MSLAPRLQCQFQNPAVILIIIFDIIFIIMILRISMSRTDILLPYRPYTTYTYDNIILLYRRNYVKSARYGIFILYVRLQVHIYHFGPHRVRVSGADRLSLFRRRWRRTRLYYKKTANINKPAVQIYSVGRGGEERNERIKGEGRAGVNFISGSVS